MSAIAGFYYPDGRPVNRTLMEQMVDVLAHRGPDAAGLWSEGSVGLGHRMLWTTPESLHEQLPFEDQVRNVVLTADARVDNRDELIVMLGLGNRPAGGLTDSRLVLAAYEKWGERCPEKLVGDFAFAIWDGRQQTLFCARDHFGIKPFFFYSKRGQVFVFGSEIKAILCHPEVPRRLDELRVGYHLALTLEDKVNTFYQNIHRLPPAHSLTVSSDGMRLREYWSLDPERELHLRSDDEYAEAFRELFTEAVRCRLRSVYPVGCMLSGGLDSSAVTCVARELLAENGSSQLHTFSVVYDTMPECDERSYIDVVLSAGNLEPHYIPVDQLGPLAHWKRVFWHQDETYASPTLFLHWELCAAAQKQGIRVLLDGLDGDTAVSHGGGYLAELARKSRWSDFLLEARAISQHENRLSVPFLLQSYGFPYLSELSRKRRWFTFAREASDVSRHFHVPRRYLVRNYGLKPLIPDHVMRGWRNFRGRNQPTRGVDPLIRQDFARRIALDEHIEAVAGYRSVPPRSAREEHHKMLMSGLLPHGFEMADTGAAACGIEARHPFSDRRLIEFCLAMPAEQKLRQGWNRVVLRRAMENILPEEIQWRGSKSSNSAAFTQLLLNFEVERLDEMIMNGQEHLGPYVDTGVLRERYQRYRSRKKADGDEMVVWQAVTLAMWLRHTALTP